MNNTLDDLAKGGIFPLLIFMTPKDYARAHAEVFGPEPKHSQGLRPETVIVHRNADRNVHLRPSVLDTQVDGWIVFKLTTSNSIVKMRFIPEIILAH